MTIQARVVYVEGCVRDPALAGRIEAFVRALPYVQQAMAIVRSDPKALQPYKVRPP